MTQQEQFGKRLRQLRREKSATEERDVEQGEVAEAVGDTQPNLARWERGRIPKDDDTVRRLAAYYGVNFIWLRHGDGEKAPTQPKRVTQERQRTELKRPATQPAAKKTGS